MTTPKFASVAAWEQAEMLMQPIFIRLIDNIRKALDASSWKGTYREELLWPENVTPETQARVMQLQLQMAIASPEEAAEIEQTLAQLPKPHPGYQLLLERQDRQISVDLWQLCYQICFKNYSPIVNLSADVLVEIDTSLIDEFGEVDWQRLDEKTHRMIEQIFASLPKLQEDEAAE